MFGRRIVVREKITSVIFQIEKIENVELLDNTTFLKIDMHKIVSEMKIKFPFILN